MKLEVQTLDAGYGRAHILHAISVSVRSGQCVAVIGANGAGKTTLLNTIGGLIRPSGGTIVLNDEDVTRLSAHERVRKGMVLVPEGRHLFPDLSVRDNLEASVHAARHRRSAFDFNRIVTMFPVLAERAAVRAGKLSGGEQQMLAIARALLLGPSLVMLDEPSTGLAPRVVREVMETIRGLASQDVGVLIVEQNAREVLRIATDVYVLERGFIVQEGNPESIIGNDSLRRSYLGS